MSLLTRPRHAVIVQLRASVLDDEGIENLAPVGDPLVVRCNVKPITTAEAEAYGITARETYRITARDWPGDHLSLMITTSWAVRGDMRCRCGSPCWSQSRPS